MGFVIDANVLFAALIKDSITAKILFDCTIYAPELIFSEFEKHKEMLIKKTQRNREDFIELFELFQQNIIIIPMKEIKPFMAEVDEFSPDLDDSPYLALALKLGCPLWSNDKDLKRQNRVKILSTEDLVKLLGY